MKRSDLRSMAECYKAAFGLSCDMAVPAAAFVWSVLCIFFMPLIWAFFWVVTTSDKGAEDV